VKWIDTLIKLRKDSVEGIERELVKLQSNINIQNITLVRLNGEFRSVEIPQQANGAMLQQISMQRSFAMSAIKEQEMLLQKLEKKAQELTDRLLEANKELEQAKYIKADYVQKAMQKAKQKEQKIVDELASQRFFIKRQGVRNNG
jgi:flagellar export protein FliJ